MQGTPADDILGSRGFFRAAIDALSANIAVIDASGTIVATNRPWDDFSTRNGGASEKTGVGSNYLEECDRAAARGHTLARRVAAALRDILDGHGEELLFEYPCHSQNEKEKRWFLCRLTPFPDMDPPRVMAVHENITAGKRAQAAALRSQRLFHDLFELAADAIVMTDGDGIIRLANQQCEETFGWSRAELIGRPVETLIPPEVRERHPELRQALMAKAERRALSANLQAMRADGTRLPVEISLNPLETADGQMVVATVRDVSDRSDLELRLRQSQKLESVGQLAAGIAHDFNNTLTVINGTVELMIDRLGDDNPLQRDLDTVLQAGAQAATLTAQLLAFSRRQILQPAVVNLNTLVSDTEDLLRRVLGEHIRLLIRCQEDLPDVTVDPGQFHQVILNLAVNSRDAMPYGGSLTFQTRTATPEEIAEIDPPADSAGPHVVLQVSDDGVGMDQPSLNLIFEPFFTTKSSGRGTGLGLATVFGIVKQSNGDIRVSSELGKGTTFRIFLPATHETPGQPQPVPAPTTGGGSERVLVVDDDDDVRNLTRRALESFGYTVLLAANGDEALRILETETTAPELVLTDVVMPGISGRKLAEKVRKLLPETKILFSSGYTDNAIVQHGVLDKDVHFISKPYSITDLAAKVREVLDSPS